MGSFVCLVQLCPLPPPPVMDCEAAEVDMEKDALVVTTKRDVSLDFIRILATIGVIAIHTDVITSSTTNYLGGVSWWFANTVHSLAVVSVPLFLMLTGALVLPRQVTDWKYPITKVVERFVIPLIFWWWFYSYWDFGWITPATSPLVNFFTTNVGHLYYLQVTIGAYLLLPLLTRFTQHIPSSLRKWVFIGAIGLSMGLMYGRYRLFSGIDLINMFTIALPLIPYLYIGQWLSQRTWSKRMGWWVIASLGLLTIVTSGLTYANIRGWNSGHRQWWTAGGGNFFFEPFTVNVLLMSGLSFVLLRAIGNRVGRWINPILIQYLADLTLGIYLIHPLMLALVDHYFNLAIHQVTYPLWIYYLLKIFLVTLVSGIAVALIRLVPVVNTILGVPLKRKPVGTH